MKYKQIDEDDVYKVLVNTSLDIMNPINGCISVSNLASLLKTSKYQVRKHIKSLKDKEFVVLECHCIHSEDEIYPPYWGYTLTKKGRETEYFEECEKWHIKLIEECFGVEVYQ